MQLTLDGWPNSALLRNRLLSRKPCDQTFASKCTRQAFKTQEKFLRSWHSLFLPFCFKTGLSWKKLQRKKTQLSSHKTRFRNYNQWNGTKKQDEAEMSKEAVRCSSYILMGKITFFYRCVNWKINLLLAKNPSNFAQISAQNLNFIVNSDTTKRHRFLFSIPIPKEFFRKSVPIRFANMTFLNSSWKKGCFSCMLPPSLCTLKSKFGCVQNEGNGSERK